MELKINKEIRNYMESMFFGLSVRQFIFSVLACGVAVGLYFPPRPKSKKSLNRFLYGLPKIKRNIFIRRY